MIQIGINKSVYLDKASVDEKNVLELSFLESDKASTSGNMFANIASDDVVEDASRGIRLFPPLPPKKEDITQQKKVELVNSDITKTKGILMHILLGYYTREDLKGLWAEVFAGLPIDENSYPTKITQKEILEGVHKNMSRIFLQKIAPFLGNKELTFRLLLVRQSKDKHYATFRGKFIEDNPFYESTQVPEEASKLKFTPYEIQEGLDNGIPVPKSAADAKAAGGTGGAAPQTVQNVFGNG